MKLKNGFVLRQVGGQTVVLPSGSDLDLNMMITLNDTGKFLWEKLEKGADHEELIRAICAEFEVEEQRARDGVVSFVENLKRNGFLENE